MHLIGHRKTTTEKLLDQGQHAWEDLAERAAPHVEAARTKLVTDVIPTAQQTAQQARDTAQQKAIPAARQAMETARDTALPVAAAAAAAAKARADQHLPHRQRKESHKVRTTVLLLGLAGLGVAAWRKLAPGHQDPVPYVPPQPHSAPSSTMQPPPTPRHAGGTAADRATAQAAGAGTDAAGATPGEALSDATDTPHASTTPAHPAEAERLSDRLGDREP